MTSSSSGVASWIIDIVFDVEVITKFNFSFRDNLENATTCLRQVLNRNPSKSKAAVLSSREFHLRETGG